MDILIENILGVKHIYIPDGLELDDTAYEILNWFAELKTISISSNHLKPSKEVRYKCEIRGTEKED